MNEPLKICVLEDNASDRKLLQTSIERNPLLAELHFSKSIEEFQYFINNTSLEELPDLILLDLNIAGEETLPLIGEIKRRKDMQYIPVIIMIRRAYKDVMRTELPDSC
jgi:CheY-like chemotaxis protein